MTIERATESTLHAWHAMRARLWPEYPPEMGESVRMLADPDLLNLIARDGDDVLGFAEASIRRDNVNGCESSPVVFLEGIYVEPRARRRGIARAFCDAVAAWGRERGLTEFASDALIDNFDSHAMHRALGFDETERVVNFRRVL